MVRTAPVRMWAAMAALAVAAGAAEAAPAVEPLELPLSAAAWSGAVTAVAAGPGQPAQLRWQFEAMDGIVCREIPRDVTGFNALAFTLESDRATTNRLSVILYSHNEAAEGPDYYLTTLPLDFAGSLEVILAFDEMAVVRQPRGWDQIDQLQFHNNWSREPEVAPQQVTFSRLRLMRLPPGGVKGPRLDDEAFFAMLDLDRPELAAVREAWRGGDGAGARRALAAHVRQRQAPLWTVRPEDRPTLGVTPPAAHAGIEKGGRYSLGVALERSGWQCLRLPLADFRAEGTPVGWEWVSGLRLSWRVQGDPYDGRELHLDDVALVGPGGRRSLGDFESEASGWEGLYRDESQARQGRASGRWWFPEIFPSAACQRYPADWRPYEALELWVRAGQPGDRLEIAVTSALPDTRRAEEILTRTFTIGGFKKHPYAFGERIDWSANAMTEGESRTIEWNAQLNRHFHFADLYNAYWSSGDERYAAELAAQMRGWIEDNPVLLMRSGNSPYHHAWETLNTGIRLHNTWPETLERCRQSPAFTDEVIILVLKSIAEQVRHLLRHPSRGNWLTAESLGVYTSGVLYPEFRDAAAWRAQALERLYRQLDEEVYPDGMQFELALGYNTWVLAEFVQVLRLARLNGLMEEVPADYRSRLAKMYEYLMKVSRPNGTAFGLNDAGDANVRRLLIDGYDLFPERADLVYPVTQGRAGRPPVSDSAAMPYTGHYVMRTGWDEAARLLHLDSGPFGAGHQHEDKLSILIYAYGRPLLVEGGVVMYDRSRWRTYVLQTRSHNTVMIDGMEQYRRADRESYVRPRPWTAPTPEGDETRWASADGVDWCEGWYRGAYRPYRGFDAAGPAPEPLEGVSHRRGVLFVKPDFWIVHDTVQAKAAGPHRAEALFHIHAESAEAVAAGGVIATSAKGPGLLLQPIGGTVPTATLVEGQGDEPVQGWSRQYGRAVEGVPMRAVPTALLSWPWDGHGDLVTVVWPTAPGERVSLSPAALPITAGAGLAAGFQAAPGDSAAVYLRNNTPGQRLEAGGCATDGEVAFLGTLAARGLRACLVNGRSLEGQGVLLRLESVGTAAATAWGEDVIVVASDVGGRLALRCNAWPAGTTPRVQALGRDWRPAGSAEASLADGILSWNAQAGVAYEVAWGTGSAYARRAPEALAAVSRPQLDVPVRALAEQPAARGQRLMIQAEDFSGQAGGEVEVTAGKVDAVGRSFLHWDQPGHAVEYTVEVPVAGAYALTLRYCTADEQARRAILVDGALPDASLGACELPWTGGWSSAASDWRLLTVAGVDGKPFRFHLTAGRHTLRLVNVQGSANLDWLCLHDPDQAP